VLKGLNQKDIEHDTKSILREAALMARCGIHPHIVEVKGCSPSLTKIERPIIVMELMRTTLFDALHYPSTSRGKTYLESYSERMKVLRGIAGAIEFLHLQGIVHHDVKTLNILLDKGRELAKLTDFGEAKVKGLKTTRFSADSISTAAGGRSVGGTLAYQVSSKQDTSL